MRYAKLEKNEIVNGKGVGVTLGVQGCPIHCEGCFNPETWGFDGGKKFDNDTFNEIGKLLNKPYITRFSILGGEPLVLENLCDLGLLTKEIKEHFPHIKIGMGTGYTGDKIQQTIYQFKDDFNNLSQKYMYLERLLENVDYLIAGPFIQEEKDLTLQWCGSRNQEVIDMRATIRKGEKVLYVTN